MSAAQYLVLSERKRSRISSFDGEEVSERFCSFVRFNPPKERNFRKERLLLSPMKTLATMRFACFLLFASLYVTFGISDSSSEYARPSSWKETLWVRSLFLVDNIEE